MTGGPGKSQDPPLTPLILQDLGIENVARLTAFDGVGHLLDRLGVQAYGGFDCYVAAL